MFAFDKIPNPTLGRTGLEAALSEEERAVQDAAHHFAEEVMRPIGAKLDRMSAEEVVAAGSPLWDYVNRIVASGLLDLKTLGAMPPEQKARMLPLIFEELGWGDPGLAIFSLATAFPAFAAHMSGDPELIERFGSSLGCWVGTQPDRGSDLGDIEATQVHPGTRQGRGNLFARVVGDEVVINGQCSAWVSGAPVAQTGYVFCQCDYGDGLWNDRGGLNYIAALVPFDKNVTKGKPLEKMGQRPLPQGEIYFNDVVIPKKYVTAGKDTSYGAFFGALTFANMEMALTFTGVARAAFEHALAYVHERQQGGTQLVNHQSVRQRLFDMWRKVETARAIAQRVVNYNFGPNGPHVLGSITSKTYATQAAFDVANEALQMFGGNGLTREYPLEKLFRDARAALIEDGENNLLSLVGASWLSTWYKREHGL
ncbi:MAG: acyl-CoA/acyl-ACP dehydrogenase [Burkholderiales bacterium]|nr:acyl-CoA/acyl-ACP dehydrogenase [Burkholderiales bacterium]